MKRAKIINNPSSSGSFATVTTNTSLPQRDTLEEIIINLATALGAKEIYKARNARGSYFYEVQAPGFRCFQSASNTILELSKKISKNT